MKLLEHLKLVINKTGIYLIIRSDEIIDAFHYNGNNEYPITTLHTAGVFEIEDLVAREWIKPDDNVIHASQTKHYIF